MKIRLEELSGGAHTARVITELGIGNFKAFGEMQRVPIKPLTLIFGANSSGKSSIIHSLLLLNEFQSSGRLDVHRPRKAGDTVDLGGLRNYVHRHDPHSTVIQHLETLIPTEELRDQLLGASDEELAYFCRFARFGITLSWSDKYPALQVCLDGEPVLSFQPSGENLFTAKLLPACSTLLLPEAKRMMEEAAVQKAVGKHLGNVWMREGEQDEEFKSKLREGELAVAQIKRPFEQGEAPTPAALSEFNGTFAAVMAEDNFTFDKLRLADPRPDILRNWLAGMSQLQEQIIAPSIRGFFQEWAEGEPAFWAEAQALRYGLSSILQVSCSRIARVISGIRYLGPLRRVPSRNFTESEDDNTVTAPWLQLVHSASLLQDVNRWLGDRLQTPYSLRMRQLLDEEGHPRGDFPEFVDSATQTSLSHRDLGFGMSQMMPVLLEAATAKSRLVPVEQPELHLHPAQQAALGDVFIESALGERKNSFLLETHSEHLILRILRRVRETTEGTLPEGYTPIRPEQVSVVYVQPGSKGAEVLELPVTPDGDFGRPWPGGFFAERLQDLP